MVGIPTKDEYGVFHMAFKKEIIYIWNSHAPNSAQTQMNITWRIPYGL
jgi:hypothetical protein